MGLALLRRLRSPFGAISMDGDLKERLNLATVGLAALLAGGAIVLEHGFGLAPCALCLTQRLLAILAGLVAAVGLAHGPRLGIYPLLTILASIAGGYFAVRHLYLLTLPADQVPSCGVDFDYMLEVFPLVDVLRAMTSGTSDCAEQGATIPALALAGFAGLLALAIAQWRHRPGN